MNREDIESSICPDRHAYFEASGLPVDSRVTEQLIAVNPESGTSLAIQMAHGFGVSAKNACALDDPVRQCIHGDGSSAGIPVSQ
ncbi:MAG: hypothetical protein HRT46_12230 [Deltaproteobacteria bacterium]|nr:hypothetical protein [Deltaproteobacteria bacterium]